MRERKMSIKLTASDWMDAKGGAEHERVRIPRRARGSFEVKGKRVVIHTDKHTGALEVKKARNEDVAPLIAKMKAGEITAEELSMTAFVTSQTLKLFVGRRKRNLEEHCYISESIDALMLGADPEFALIDPSTGALKYAEHTEVLKKTDILGHDGPLAEIRPTPANNVHTLVQTIGSILKDNSKKIAKFDWRGGATYKGPLESDPRTYHIGGHIHLGDPSLLPPPLRTPVYQRLTQILDETVALPLVRIDTPNPYLRRNTMHGGFGRYGRYGDHKAQEGRIEWRVPSGLWLIHPEMATAVLGTTKAVTESCYHLMAEKQFNKEWICAYPDSSGLLKTWGAMKQADVESLLNNADPDSISTSCMTRAIKKLRDLLNYEQYKDEIELFISLVKMSEKDRSKINLDLKDNWLNNGKIIK